MRKLLVALMLSGVVISFSTGRAEEAKKKEKTVTLKGTLVDTKCFLQDGEKGNDHEGMKACGTDCLKDGTPAGLLTDKGLYILVFPSPTFADYVGKTLEVTGKVYGKGNLVPDKASVVEKGKKTAIKLKSMM